MRADRLLSILLLLQVHRRLTARDLADRLEVSERTIHRDMVALSGAGIPVLAERGAGGGWSLLEGYRTNLTGMNDAEIRSLLLTRPTSLLADLGLEKASDTALIKLLAALPALSRRDAEYARQRLHVDGAGWHTAREAVPFLLALQEAIWQECRLHLTYHRGDGRKIEREIDPLGLIAKGSVWYVVAATTGEIRSYRVSRVEHLKPTGERCIRPPDFDLARYWEESKEAFTASLPQFPVTVRADHTIVASMRSALRFARIDRIEQPDDDGWVCINMMFEEEHNACEFLLSYGARIEVVEPDSLRQQVIQVAQDIVARYTYARPAQK